MNAAGVLCRVRAIGHDDSLVNAISACKGASEPDRDIDARIALAEFPALRSLTVIAPAAGRRQPRSGTALHGDLPRCRYVGAIRLLDRSRPPGNHRGGRAWPMDSPSPG